ncbi:biological adhesion [Homalodisca vitripennis]|nr:biological adhesion [Homalodisca vitripennis]
MLNSNRYFKELPHSHISHLDVVGAGLDTVDSDSLGSQVETLRLITNNIINIGDKTFLNRISSLDTADWSYLRDTLDTLFLGENDLQELPLGALVSLRRLAWLNLDHNKLRTVRAENLPESLQTLSVQHNYLSELPDIEPLYRLVRLCLRGNNLRSVTLRPVHRRRQFEKVDLGDNLISELHQIFNSSVVIRDLNLDSNHITTLNDNVFYGTKAGRIILAMNKIDNISQGAFSGLEDTLEYIDLERNLLAKFPNAISHLRKLKYLYLPMNKITKLDNHEFTNFSKSLKAVSLAGNQFDHVPQQALEKCVKLTHVNLGYNLIRELKQDDFIGWGEYVDTLLLQNNRIMRLGSNVFNNTPNLRELSLSFNRLLEIESDTFSDVAKSLESLEISFGLYRDDFPEDFLRPLTSLVWLALDNNNLKLISNSALSTFDKLQYLNLESNRLTELPRGLFNASFHKNLRVIRLSYNHINALDPNTFSSMHNLQTVVLTGNNIRTIYPKAFNKLPNLMKVILSQNRVSTIHPSAFSFMSQLKKLDLQLNELRELSLNVFSTLNASSSISLNVSRNEIAALSVGEEAIPIKINSLDISHNRLSDVPSQFLYFVENLTRLNLGYNMIYQINPFSFTNTSKLETLNLQHNGIVFVRRKAFIGLSSLQILDLSHNHIKSLQVSQFSSCPLLRVVDLSSNHIRTLPRDVFQNTRIEGLDLSNNEFIIFPSQSFGDIGFTLRHLDLSYNQIDRLDSTMFHETQFLTSLNLCRNKLTILPDNVFTGLGNLLNLQLCRNPLTANFKELLHYIPKLRRLDLSFTALRTAPHFPLQKLTYLNLSGNHLQELPTTAVESLLSLKTLILSSNRLSSLPTPCWPRVPLLKHLDVSSNPLQVLTAESFQGLQRLESLSMTELPRLERWDAGSLAGLRVLTTLSLQS